MKKRYYKVVNAEVVSVGFPSTSFETIFDSAVYYEDSTDGKIRNIPISPSIGVDMRQFEQWKNVLQNTKVANANDAKTSELSQPNAEKKVLEALRNYRIEQKTPMDCMLFISKLKKDLLPSEL